MAGRLERGQVRLFPFASPDKKRPVLVLTRGSAIRYLNKVTVAPISSSIRDVPSEVILDEDDGMKRPCSVNLHHMISVPKGRLGARLAHSSAPTACARFAMRSLFRSAAMNISATISESNFIPLRVLLRVFAPLRETLLPPVIDKPLNDGLNSSGIQR